MVSSDELKWKSQQKSGEEEEMEKKKEVEGEAHEQHGGVIDMESCHQWLKAGGINYNHKSDRG